MNLRSYGLTIMAAVGLLALAQGARAQTMGELGAGMAMQDTLSGSSVGPAVGPGSFDPIGRARNAAGTMQGRVPGFAGVAGPGMPGAMGAPGMPVNRGPLMTVITGTRVFDAISGRLIDDAVEKQVPESDKANYYDDGTHGDVTPSDGRYTRVDQRKDSIEQSHQRIKERLVNALIIAEGLDPLQFYGFSLMSTDRFEAVPRNVAWKMVPDPKGGVGQVLVEKPVDEPLEVPKYRTWERRKDIEVVRDDWVKNFLVEYRKTKDNLTSEFYPMYVPVPPPIPLTAPPPGWQPYSDPGAMERMAQGGGAGMVGGEYSNRSRGVTRTDKGSLSGARGTQLNRGGSGAYRSGGNRVPTQRGSGMGQSNRRY